jgi:hypothetical protein
VLRLCPGWGRRKLRGVDDAIHLQHRQSAIGLVRILRRREHRRNLRIKRSCPRSGCCGCARCSRRQSDSDQRSGRSGIVKVSRTGRPSITETERLRSANLLQTPRGPLCKLRQRGREYGGPAGSRGIDPSLQPLPFAAIAGAVLYGRAASRRPGRAFRLNPNITVVVF